MRYFKSLLSVIAIGSIAALCPPGQSDKEQDKVPSNLIYPEYHFNGDMDGEHVSFIESEGKEFTLKIVKTNDTKIQFAGPAVKNYMPPQYNRLSLTSGTNTTTYTLPGSEVTSEFIRRGRTVFDSYLKKIENHQMRPLLESSLDNHIPVTAQVTH
jgi:hypothetical protein